MMALLREYRETAHLRSTLLVLVVVAVTLLLGRGWLEQRQLMADKHEQAIDLEQQIPTQFGAWKLAPAIGVVEISAEAKAALAGLYEQQISRIYQHSSGARVMLSLVYGRDQSNDLSQAHRPEICYTAQGFDVSDARETRLNVPGHSLPVTRLFTRQGNRIEPLTYWMVIGDNVVRPGLDRKLTQFVYAFERVIPDGVLMRLSSLDEDRERAYQWQDRFAADLLAALDPATRQLLAGTAP